MDRWLGFHSLFFVLHGAEIAPCGVAATRIIEAFDIVEHVRLGIIPGPVDLAGTPFGLKRGEKALHRRVLRLQTIPRPDRLIR